MGKLLLHFELFQLVAAKYHQAFDLGAVVENRLHKRFAKRASSPSDEDGLVADINRLNHKKSSINRRQQKRQTVKAGVMPSNLGWSIFCFIRLMSHEFNKATFSRLLLEWQQFA